MQIWTFLQDHSKKWVYHNKSFSTYTETHVSLEPSRRTMATLRWLCSKPFGCITVSYVAKVQRLIDNAQQWQGYVTGNIQISKCPSPQVGIVSVPSLSLDVLGVNPSQRYANYARAYARRVRPVCVCSKRIRMSFYLFVLLLVVNMQENSYMLFYNVFSDVSLFFIFPATLQKQNCNFSKHLLVYTTVAWLSLLCKCYKCNAGNWELMQL